MKPPTFNRAQLHDRVTRNGVTLVSNDFNFVDAHTDEYDCNVAQTSQCVQLATGVKLSAKQCREIANDPSGGTSTAFATAVFLDQGMASGEDFVRFHRVDVQRVRDLLLAGWYVVLFVDYSVINDNLAGMYAGSIYRGAHVVGLCGWKHRKVSGKFERIVFDYDPLADGRNRPNPLPDAPFGRQLAPFWLFRHAAESYSKEPNIVSGYAVKGV